MHKSFVTLLSLLLLTATQAQDIQHDCSIHRIERYKRLNQTLSAARVFVGEDFNIIYHRCNWEVDPSIKYISGSITTYFKPVISSLTKVDFELHNGMSVDSVVYHGVSRVFTHSSDILSTILPSAVPLSLTDSITVYYKGTPAASGGFGAFEQSTQGGLPIIWTLSEPYGAKYWWPSKNDLSDKIDSIDIFVKTPSVNKVASNGLLMSISPVGNQSVYHWKHRYPIANYLVAIAVTPYAVYDQSISLPGGNLPVKNFIFPADTAAARISLNNLVPVYSFFDSLFIPYPFSSEKYGHAQFGWGGGMEHQTITFMGGWSWDILVHEFAHQWFGDYITCGSWHDIWLNEGFATYLTGLAYERFAPAYWMSWKSSTINHVTSQPDGSVYVDDTTSVNRVFSGRLSYSKGATVLHMLRHVMGNQQFFQGLNSYLNDPFLSYGYAMTDNLKAHLENACSCSLTGFFNDWVYGEGYPSYSIHIEKHQGSQYRVIVNQTASDTSSVAFFALPLPLRFYSGTKDSSMIVNNQFNGESFWLDPGFVADSVVFDPDLWLVTKNNSLTMGVKEDLNTSSISIFPNPTEDFLNIKNDLTTTLQWSVFSCEGRLLLSGSAQASQLQTIDITALAKGLYFIKLSDSKTSFTRKFVRK